MQKEYLGDAVYAEFDEYDDLRLTTEDGERATNTIVLEPQVLHALYLYLAALRDEIAAEEEGESTT